MSTLCPLPALTELSVIPPRITGREKANLGGASSEVRHGRSTGTSTDPSPGHRDQPRPTPGHRDWLRTTPGAPGSVRTTFPQVLPRDPQSPPPLSVSPPGAPGLSPGPLSRFRGRRGRAGSPVPLQEDGVGEGGIGSLHGAAWFLRHRARQPATGGSARHGHQDRHRGRSRGSPLPLPAAVRRAGAAAGPDPAQQQQQRQQPRRRRHRDRRRRRRELRFPAYTASTRYTRPLARRVATGPGKGHI